MTQMVGHCCTHMDESWQQSYAGMRTSSARSSLTFCQHRKQHLCPGGGRNAKLKTHERAGGAGLAMHLPRDMSKKERHDGPKPKNLMSQGRG